MNKFRIHVLGLPHTQTTKEFVGCAFTQKAHKFLKMMSGRGHEIFHYGHTNIDWSYPDVEHVPVINDDIVRIAYGNDYVDNKIWKEHGFASFYNINDFAYQTFTQNTIKEINARKQPNDIVCLTFGFGHKAIADQLDDLICIESGIGYPGAFARWRIYESHAIMNALAGRDAVAHCQQDWYHRVIGNYFDSEDFTYSADKDDYLLYLGRIGGNKGVDIAIDLAKTTGKQLVIAGQGTLKSMGYTNLPDNIVEFGYADADQRRTLMSRAQALFIGSTYLEPFAGVQVEAWLSGTPVISPDWAAFAEMNVHGLTGIRCNTFKDFVQATEEVKLLKPADCRRHGEQWLLENIAPKYERYFEDVLNVYTGKGWYTL